MATSLMARMARNSRVLQANHPLADHQIMQVAPSIFSVEAHDRVSERYTVIPTIAVLNALRKEGFMPFMVAQTKVRDADRREYAKHMLRLRRASDITANDANEVILINSHDGKSSYQMTAGILRFVCMNGLVCGDNIIGVKVRHSGDVVDHVVEGAYTIAGEFTRVNEARERMRAIELKPREQLAFANSALLLKYDEGEAPVTAEQILRPRRWEDEGNDLWRTFNRVQENMTKGGLCGVSATGRKVRTRAVEGLNRDLKLNKALWTLADEMAKLAA